MAAIDFNQILSDCIGIAKKELGGAWQEAEPFAAHAFQQYAEDVAKLMLLRQEGKITEEAFRYYMDIQQLGLWNVLLAVKGVGVLAAQNTINGIIDVVSTAVSSAIGFVL